MQSAPSLDALDTLLAQAREKVIVQPTVGLEQYDNEISVDVLRADLIHPVISGNKLFKLYYYLSDAIQKNHTIIHTFGGAWSNHIVASAFAARLCGLRSVGFIRGEEPVRWSQTLLDARSYGMELIFLPRHEFDALTTFQKGYFPKGVLSKRGTFQKGGDIPMGGYGENGARGAAKMLDHVDLNRYSHIFCAAGTGTMAAGLAMAAGPGKVHAVNVVKGADLDEAVKKLHPGAGVTIYNEYHMGGYAKATEQLIDQMNSFYAQNTIPTDFVYTGKLMFAIRDLARKNAFPKGSRILAVHSGGLQGNKSLKIDQLHF